jgi:hypothetical protein
MMRNAAADPNRPPMMRNANANAAAANANAAATPYQAQRDRGLRFAGRLGLLP